MDDDNNRNKVKNTQDITNSMAFINKSVKNQVFQEEGNPDRESVERMLGFIQNNKKELAKFGFVSENPIIQVKTPDIQSKPPQNNNNAFNNNNMTTPSNYNNTKPFVPNDRNTMPQMKNREMMSTLANNKINQVAIRDKVQKECLNAITDITSNRLNQAKTDIENALNLMRELK